MRRKRVLWLTRKRRTDRNREERQCLCVYMCVHVSVCERENKTGREKEGQREGGKERE